LGIRCLFNPDPKIPDKGNTLVDSPNAKQRMFTINPKDLIGRTFLMDSDEDGQRFRARVFCAVVDKEENLKKGI
jgi:hypothetical protein